MKKWEYFTKYIESDSFDTDEESKDIYHSLDKSGAKGWELVSFFPDYWETNDDGNTSVQGYRAVFKRPLED